MRGHLSGVLAGNGVGRPFGTFFKHPSTLDKLFGVGHRGTSLRSSNRSMKKQLLVAAALIAFASSGMAQDKHTQVTPDAVIWKDNPAFPKGVQTAALVGNQTKAGDTVVLRIQFPANFQMPPHTHPYSEVVTIISGAIVRISVMVSGDFTRW